ncbi:centrosomal protein of 57 kDa [Periophthalmus magnuspinnatus]|uniref:centrosomal protein of 57 kDa n=1 Tax=Periophthalmus magnuspinnatus TaxID=409849 RepID=UPI00145B54B1|nr:centrosomal protein of 57 kDa [Periophthalmus magnuspinnatus]
MDPPAATTSADALRERDLHLQLQTAPSGLVCDSLSLPSYKEYPAQRPFITTLVQSPTAQTYRASSPCKAFPETNSAAILSALRNLQEKIRKLEKDKGHVSLPDPGKDMKNTSTQSDTDINKANCNQVLINHLASAESRCLKLEKQLDQTRKMLRSATTDKSNIFNQVRETTRSADQSTDSPSVLARLEKLDHLEQEYLRLTHTQNKAERKIDDLELKLQEEEHQRKLVENKANLLQVGLETNRILLQSVSPYRKSKDKESKVKKSSLQQSPTEPHYKFRLRDVPFVAGTSVGNSHSVRANVQSVLSLLKCHQPHLCNSRVLSNKPYGLGIGSQSFSSSSSSSNEDELSDLLHALQEELRLMSLEQEELLRKVERSVSEQERKDLQREQEKLLLKMERKGEQINKLYKHKSQVNILLKESNNGRVIKNVGATRKFSSRGHSTEAAKLRPGERSRRNLRLLKDMRALQMSLQT